MNAPSKKTAVLATAFVLSLGGAAHAATSASTAPTPLSGSATDKVAAAAVAKHPGSTLVGLESESDGTYDAQVQQERRHVRRAHARQGLQHHRHTHR